MSQASLQNISEKWLPELRNGWQTSGATFLLVGTQIDLRDDSEALQRLSKKQQRPITTEQGHKLAKKYKMDGYVECSALTQKGLKNVFDEAILGVLAPKEKKPVNSGLSAIFGKCLGR